MAGNAAAQASIAARVTKTYGPMLQQIGFVPREGEPPTVALLRPTLISTLGKFGDPSVAAEAKRLFAAWQTNSNAIPGSLKSTWLKVIARNATPAEWDVLHAKAKSASSAVERQTLYSLLGSSPNEALGKRALELAMTDEPGKTVSAGIISSVAGQHPRLAVDFVLAHLKQVNELLDISGRSRFMQGLAQNSGDATLIPVIEAYAKANLAESDRAPISRAVDRIRYDAAKRQRIAPEIVAWLAAHPA
jgi:aminopeptidase N